MKDPQGVSVNVIKRSGDRPSESFDYKKLHASIVAACLSVRTPEGVAEATATTVCNTVVTWLKAKPEVTSGDLRRKAGETLHQHHPDAAYIYKNQRLVI